MSDANGSEQRLRDGGSMAKAVPKLSKKERERAEAVKELREILKPGDTVYTVLRHVSRSGMTRYISLYALKDNEPRYLDYWANEVLGWGMSRKHEGVKVEGCGMDMGFSVVYNLSSALYRGIGYDCIEDAEKGIRCPAAAHVNERDKSKIPSRHYDGYALRHRWI